MQKDKFLFFIDFSKKTILKIMLGTTKPITRKVELSLLNNNIKTKDNNTVPRAVYNAIMTLGLYL